MQNEIIEEMAKNIADIAYSMHKSKNTKKTVDTVAASLSDISNHLINLNMQMMKLNENLTLMNRNYVAVQTERRPQ